MYICVMSVFYFFHSETIMELGEDFNSSEQIRAICYIMHKFPCEYPLITCTNLGCGYWACAVGFQSAASGSNYISCQQQDPPQAPRSVQWPLNLSKATPPHSCSKDTRPHSRSKDTRPHSRATLQLPHKRCQVKTQTWSFRAKREFVLASPFARYG